MNASIDSISLKEKQVKGLSDSISKAKTLIVASIKGLPSKQFQEIKKSIREHASVKVSKKNIMIRAIKQVGKESILPLEEYINSDCAFVISDLDAYELAGILSKKKTPVFAKAGQVATEDIEVKAGPTDLVPGPAISELGALGLQVAVEDGKISIKQDRVVVNEGQEINEGAASLFQKLNIQPFSVGLEIEAAYDVEKEKIYTEVKIDSQGYTEELKTAAGKALGFAQKIAYYCNETIGYFLAKANSHAQALEKLAPAEEVKEASQEESKEEGEEKTDEGSESSNEEAGKEEGGSEGEPAEKEENKEEDEKKSEENTEENSQLNNEEDNK